MRSVKVKICGFTVLEFIDDSGENMIEALRKLVDDEPEEEDNGGFRLDPRTEGDLTNIFAASGEHLVFAPDLVIEEEELVEEEFEEEPVGDGD